MQFSAKILREVQRRNHFFIGKIASYLPSEKNIVEYGRRWGGDALISWYDQRCKKAAQQTEAVKRRGFLEVLEAAKGEWRFSLALLSEMTDPDLIDYAAYLAKSNEARYRYLLKLARKEKLACEIWRE